MFTETNFGSSLIETKLPLHTEEQRKEFISQVVSLPLAYFYQIFYILKNNLFIQISSALISILYQ